MGLTESEYDFVERMGLAFDGLGSPRMMGRIMGYLLICEPPTRSAPQLVEELGVSKGAINTMTRQLVKAGLLERVAISGERATHFRVHTGAWADLLRQQLQGLHLLTDLAADGLRVLQDSPPERRQRLQQFHDIYVRFEREIEQMLANFAEEEDR
jgi:DNA-binding transcriptional regulator GbsR (MarR family)